MTRARRQAGEGAISPIACTTQPPAKSKNRQRQTECSQPPLFHAQCTTIGCTHALITICQQQASAKFVVLQVLLCCVLWLASLLTAGSCQLDSVSQCALTGPTPALTASGGCTRGSTPLCSGLACAVLQRTVTTGYTRRAVRSARQPLTMVTVLTANVHEKNQGRVSGLAAS